MKTLNNLTMRSLFSLVSALFLRMRTEKLAVALLLVIIPLAGATVPTHAAPNAPYEDLGGAILGTPITVSWGANRLDIFVVGTDRRLYHKAWNGNRWLPSVTDYEPLGGLIRNGSSPSITCWSPGRLDIVVIGDDRQLYHKAWDGNRWLPSATGYEPLGGLVRDGGSPAITSWGPGRLDIVVVGDDRQLYHKAWSGNRWLPSATGYEPLGGIVRDGSSPAITSWGLDRLDIAVIGDDRQLYHKAWDGNRWLPSAANFEPLGGAVRDGSSPAIVSKGLGRLDIFVIGQNQGLDHKAWESTRWLPSPTALEHLGGIISDGSSPSATAWGDSRVSVFVIGTDQGLYHKGWDGNRWWEYENLGGIIASGSSPATISWGAGRMDVFVVGGDTKLHHKARNSFQWLTDTKMAAVPISGPTKWAVLLCKTSDHPEEPKDKTFFRNLFTEDGSGLGGMFDYWRDMSYGAITLVGSQVKGWFTMQETLAQLNALSRQDKVRACVAAASSDFQNPSTNFYGIAVMFNMPFVDSGDAGSPAMLTFNGVTKPYAVLDLASNVWTTSFAAQEMGHGYRLDHSWSRRPDIEYGDPYDSMSAPPGKTFTRSLPLFGDSGPSLNAVYREALGWIPPARIYSGSVETATITLAPLGEPNVSGYLMAKIFAFGRTDRYYTVEFHRATGWDQGLQQDVVLIHEVLPDRHSYLITDDGGPERRIGQPFGDPATHLSVVVLRMDASGATIQIARVR